VHVYRSFVYNLKDRSRNVSKTVISAFIFNSMLQQFGNQHGL